MRRKAYGAKSLKQHRIIAEQALGKPLPNGVEVHHVDFNRSNNTPSNLVICKDKSYHQLLHRRHEVLDAGYNPNTHHKCTDCGKFKLFEKFSKNRVRPSGYNNLCKSCDNIRHKERYSRRVG